MILTLLLLTAISATIESETYKIYHRGVLTTGSRRASAASHRDCVNNCLRDAPKCIGYSSSQGGAVCRLMRSERTCFLPQGSNGQLGVAWVALKTSSVVQECYFHTDLALGELKNCISGKFISNRYEWNES